MKIEELVDEKEVVGLLSSIIVGLGIQQDNVNTEAINNILSIASEELAQARYLCGMFRCCMEGLYLIQFDGETSALVFKQASQEEKQRMYDVKKNYLGEKTNGKINDNSVA